MGPGDVHDRIHVLKSSLGLLRGVCIVRGSEGKRGPSRWLLQAPRAENRLRLGRGMVTKGSGLLRFCFKDKTCYRKPLGCLPGFAMGAWWGPQPVSSLWQGAEGQLWPGCSWVASPGLSHPRAPDLDTGTCRAGTDSGRDCQDRVRSQQRRC